VGSRKEEKSDHKKKGGGRRSRLDNKRRKPIRGGKRAGFFDGIRGNSGGRTQTEGLPTYQWRRKPTVGRSRSLTPPTKPTAPLRAENLQGKKKVPETGSGLETENCITDMGLRGEDGEVREGKRGEGRGPAHVPLRNKHWAKLARTGPTN